MASRTTQRPPERKPPEVEGATTASRSLAGRGRSWFRHHRVVAATSLGQLMGAWLSSLMTWLVIGIALALPTMLFLLLANIGDVSADWEGKPRISVYLKEGVSIEAGRSLARSFEGMQGVELAAYTSPDDALREFEAFSGFGDALASLEANPLPGVIQLDLAIRQPGEVRILVTNLGANELIETVSYDLEWIERLFAILALGERFVAALAFFLGLGVLLSIGNTIRLAIENRRAEIEVVKLVGGTDSFVRRPFLYLGFWYGFGGALLAWIMVQVALQFVSGPVDRLVRSYNDEFAMVSLSGGATVALLVTGAILGVLGATLAVRRHLHLIEPH